ncbi:MAG TPA: nucleotidyl transferase AbiEii/AbiGii toxin family protein [Solirubrobacteraceae bacterium]|nr:nucleotidyl transferase AbiEii/AbiGii toxin family protein [Solirubrobacteraceae bacterium]
MNDREQPVSAGLGPLPSEKIVALRDVFETNDVPYAFGGAIALFYYRDPRSTIDIDVNIFLPPERQVEIIGLLRPVYDIDVAQVAADVTTTGQARSLWGATYVDLFFADTEFHDAMARRVQRKPFLDTEINVLSPEDLLVCKMLFDRPKDWLDVEAVVASGQVTVDRRYIESALGLFVDPADARFDRWRAIVNLTGQARQ